MIRKFVGFTGVHIILRWFWGGQPPMGLFRTYVSWIVCLPRKMINRRPPERGNEWEKASGSIPGRSPSGLCLFSVKPPVPLFITSRKNSSLPSEKTQNLQRNLIEIFRELREKRALHQKHSLLTGYQIVAKLKEKKGRWKWQTAKSCPSPWNNRRWTAIAKKRTL